MTEQEATVPVEAEACDCGFRVVLPAEATCCDRERQNANEERGAG